MDLSKIGRRDGLGTARHLWELSRVWFVERLLRSVQSRLGHPLRNLMDVGCGDAFVSGFWVRLVEMMLEKTRLRSGLRQTQVSQWNGGRRMTSLATALLRMDLITSRALSRIHLKAPGLSCYLVCQKPA